MTQSGYPPGCSQETHDRYYDDPEPEIDEDAAYDEYRDSPEWYEDLDYDVAPVEAEPDGDEEDWRDAA